MTEQNSNPISVFSDNPFHVESYRIMSHETDIRGLARPEIIAALFHETAWRHTERIGLGYSSMRNRGFLWVIARFKILVRHYPSRGDMILVRTWPRKCEKIFTFRDFEAFDSRQRLLAQATGMWVLINQKTRKPVPLSFLVNMFKFHDKCVLDPTLKPLCLDKNLAIAGRWRADRSDLDFNGHVNNIHPIRWSLNAAPSELTAKSSVTAMEINYLAEVHLNDEGITRQAINDRKNELHSIVTGQNHEVARLLIRFDGRTA